MLGRSSCILIIEYLRLELPRREVHFEHPIDFHRRPIFHFGHDIPRCHQTQQTEAGIHEPCFGTQIPLIRVEDVRQYETKDPIR